MPVDEHWRTHEVYAEMWAWLSEHPMTAKQLRLKARESFAPRLAVDQALHHIVRHPRVRRIIIGSTHTRDIEAYEMVR
jgi:hypothetical protein